MLPVNVGIAANGYSPSPALQERNKKVLPKSSLVPKTGKSIKTSPSFGRALTTPEAADLAKLISRVKSEVLNIKKFSMTLFSSASPSELGKNVGIGTINSSYSRNMIKKMAKFYGIDCVQMGPHGIRNRGWASPYSSSSYSLSAKSIDLFALGSKDFGSILSKSSNALKKVQSPNVSGYAAVNKELVGGIYSEALKEAFENFKKLSDGHSLKKEFNTYKQKNDSVWLEGDALYDVLSAKYKSDQWKHWGDKLDRELFGDMAGSQEAAARIKELNAKHTDQIEFYKFNQFIAEKQLMETKKDLNSAGINILGDCPISFCYRDSWTNKKDLDVDLFLGCDNGDGTFQSWDAIMWKNTKPLEKRINRYYDLYDGVRYDAAWEYIKPYTYRHEEGSSREYLNKGTEAIESMLEVAKKRGKDLELNNFELVGGANINSEVDKIRSQTAMPEIRVAWPGFKPEEFNSNDWITIGTHDNPTVIEFAKGDKKIINDRFSSIFTGPVKGKDGVEHGSGKTSLMFSDLLGMSERFNDFENYKSPKNWVLRIPDNWEEFMNKNLSQDKGFNPAEVMKNAVVNKVKPENLNYEQKELIRQLDYYSSIIKQDGPMTTAEANKHFGVKGSVEETGFDAADKDEKAKNKVIGSMILGTTFVGLGAGLSYISSKTHHDDDDDRNGKKHSEKADNPFVSRSKESHKKLVSSVKEKIDD